MQSQPAPRRGTRQGRGDSVPSLNDLQAENKSYEESGVRGRKKTPLVKHVRRVPCPWSAGRAARVCVYTRKCYGHIPAPEYCGNFGSGRRVLQDFFLVEG